MSQVKTKKSSLDDPEIRRKIARWIERSLATIEAEKRFLNQYPEYLKRVKKEERHCKRDPLADAW